MPNQLNHKRMIYHFNGIVEKVLPTKGQWAAKKRLIVINGIAFTARCNECAFFDKVHIGTKVKFDFQIKGYEYNQRHINEIQIVEDSLAIM